MPRSLRPNSPLDLLKSEAGVINATAAMVGLGVLTVVGGVAASSVSGLIPVAQDSAAQQNAAQIGTAQGLAKIMDGKFTDLEGLEAGAYLPAYRQASGPRRFGRNLFRGRQPVSHRQALLRHGPHPDPGASNPKHGNRVPEPGVCPSHGPHPARCRRILTTIR